MNYGLLHQDAPDLIRVQVSQALFLRDAATIQLYEQRGDIVHARNVVGERGVFCIYCRGLLYRTLCGRDHPAPSLWHFAHAD